MNEVVESKVNVAAVIEQIDAVRDLQKQAMKPGVHYGIIPGTPKPTLLKPGAELLCNLYQVGPEYDVKKTDLGEDHREYEILCRLVRPRDKAKLAEGVGACSTKERKYIKTKAFPDIWNTVLKMAKKRALVDAVLSMSSCSDVFTQDIEDLKKPESKEIEAQDVINEIKKRFNKDSVDVINRLRAEKVVTTADVLNAALKYDYNETKVMDFLQLGVVA